MRARWEAKRLFATADGEADKAWGNQTIRVHPDEQWLEIRLPTPLAHLSNTPGRASTYRLSCPVGFTYRGQEWAAQTANGAVRYDIVLDPAKGRGRWHLDASWRLPARPAPPLEQLRQHRSLGSTSTPTTSPPGSLTWPATRSAHRPRSRWTWTASQPQPATAGCVARSPSCCTSPRPTAAAR